ncbi:poly-gamma-glutamate synthase PgsB [Salicibibacter cibarius]|uniref:Poly-gamma-glutamate synthase PgsB n=1 Tax=Salicibibacter cibarius TaxID=2743000 RepID=A0A7T6Z592_9BACI|nr:poly-gamma-glutamate synthase PgsB [Salicibibacter cibarius]QQK77062.1 poly-gamma-glutamate synthase PgsB [Salicibibacter cibarius]
MFTLIVAISLLIILALGMREKEQHDKNVDKIPIRVNINGTRGKSTVTRLVAGALMEADIKTVGKMTGTQARMFYWYQEEEKPIVRRLEGPNIREQKVAMKEAADVGAEAFVSECMAVHPEYQRIFQDDWMQANIGVVVNIVEDHMEVLGPTVEHVVDAYKNTIPHDGIFITSPSPFLEEFEKEAATRNTKVFVADTKAVPDHFLAKFEYMIFPENVALALAVARALGIDENTASRGMLKAKAAPGVTRVMPIVDKHKNTSYFVNGFSANEPTSTLNIWENARYLGYPTDNPIVVMNCREDRPERTKQFADQLLPYIAIDKLVLIGEGTNPIVQAYEQGNLDVNELCNLEGEETDKIYEFIVSSMDRSTIFGIGNFHGSADPLIHELEKNKDLATV